jgi:hypothetical protein
MLIIESNHNIQKIKSLSIVSSFQATNNNYKKTNNSNHFPLKQKEIASFTNLKFSFSKAESKICKSTSQHCDNFITFHHILFKTKYLITIEKQLYIENNTFRI